MSKDTCRRVRCLNCSRLIFLMHLKRSYARCLRYRETDSGVDLGMEDADRKSGICFNKDDAIYSTVDDIVFIPYIMTTVTFPMIMRIGVAMYISDDDVMLALGWIIKLVKLCRKFIMFTVSKWRAKEIDYNATKNVVLGFRNGRRQWYCCWTSFHNQLLIMVCVIFLAVLMSSQHQRQNQNSYYIHITIRIGH
jgi:hypothetical protein